MKSDISKQTAAQLLPLDPKQIRHEISRALSFINTAVRNLAGARPNVPEALKIHSVGSERLRSLLPQLDAATDSMATPDFTYEGIKEAVFTAEHPEVSTWTRVFHSKVAEKEIFTKFQAQCLEQSQEKAVAVGVLWHRFSEFMPWFICQSAAQMSSNKKRHYVIQTAFEELGMRDSSQIHPDMFWQTAMIAGATLPDQERLREQAEPTRVLDGLRKALLGCATDAEVLGILLGLEIPAVENIETIFTSLGHNADVTRKLEQHTFFRLHRQIEIEHVRLTVSNFLRFCSSPDDRTAFMVGFESGLDFWHQFWDSAAEVVGIERARNQTHA